MSEVSPVNVNGVDQLEELIEPLTFNVSSVILQQDESLVSPDGHVYGISGCRRSDAQSAIYEAVTEQGDPVSIHEGMTDAASVKLQHSADILAGLNHRMFPRVLNRFTCNHKTYVVQTSLPKDPTFADLLLNDPVAISTALSVLSQVAASLTYLHSEGWVHLGLYPANIVLSKPISISDFRYATHIGEKPGFSFYHSGYSPPELLSEQIVDPRADVYSVGALLFHAANGTPIAETGPELQYWKPTVPLAGIPQILHRCLGDRDTRYTTMEELHRDLLRLARRYTRVPKYTIATATTIGLEPSRTTNQDACAYLMGARETETGAVTWSTVCVADGMGGMESGEVASEVAVGVIIAEAATSFASGTRFSGKEQRNAVKNWVRLANEQVCSAMESRKVRGGCTLLCVSMQDRRLAVAHVGDCRLYRIRKNQIKLLTNDHSLAMAMVLQGDASMDNLREHPDRSKVTRSLGERPTIPEYYIDTLETVTGEQTIELEIDDVLLLCSDGLWEPILDDEMLQVVCNCGTNLEAAAQRLTATAIERGGSDNATIALLRLSESPERQ